MACSSDGTVAYIEFNKDEIGDPMAQNDVVSRLSKDGVTCSLKFPSTNFDNIISCMHIKL